MTARPITPDRQTMLIIVTVALVLVAVVVMVPMGSAEKVVPVKTVVDMDYLTDITTQTIIQSGYPATLSEYSLVTVDSKAFMKNADTAKKMDCTIEGKKYSIELTPVPRMIAPDAKLSTQTNEGTTVTEIPLVKHYKGRIIGEKSGDAFFTAGDEVLLGRITIGDDSYYIDELGMYDEGKIVHIVYNGKKEITGNRPLPSGDDIYVPQSIATPPSH